MYRYFIRYVYGADEKAAVDNGGEYAIMETRKEGGCPLKVVKSKEMNRRVCETGAVYFCFSSIVISNTMIKGNF